MATTDATSTIAKLDQKIGKLSITDKQWVDFIVDQIEPIKESSLAVYLTDAMKDRYRYKFDHFMRDQGCNPNLNWIAQLINDLGMFEDFTLKTYILIPDLGSINNLYRLYRTSATLA